MHVERLLKLADFLRNNLDEKLWFFGTIISPGTKQPNAAYEAGGGCGTVGCAIGWLPILFPENFAYVIMAHSGRPNVKLKQFNYPFSTFSFQAADNFFELPPYVVGWLFDPLYYKNKDFTSKELVADRIEALVKDQELYKKYLHLTYTSGCFN